MKITLGNSSVLIILVSLIRDQHAVFRNVMFEQGGERIAEYVSHFGINLKCKKEKERSQSIPLYVSNLKEQNVYRLVT